MKTCIDRIHVYIKYILIRDLEVLKDERKRVQLMSRRKWGGITAIVSIYMYSHVTKNLLTLKYIMC